MSSMSDRGSGLGIPYLELLALPLLGQGSISPDPWGVPGPDRWPLPERPGDPTGQSPEMST